MSAIVTSFPRQRKGFSDSPRDSRAGRGRGAVWLVGAGPGDPELLTVRAYRLVETADVLAYDELISPAILALAPPTAERIAVGRRAEGCRHHGDRIHPLVITRAREGRLVVRLKGGDPMVFGRGGEEAEALAEAGIPFSLVPGVSAALGAAAATGIPLTHRDVAASVTFVTAHRTDGAAAALLPEWIPAQGTLVLYMGLGRVADVAALLIAGGRSPQTPAAVVASATCVNEHVVTATLATLAETVAAAKIAPPALLIVGDVVSRAVAPVDPSWLQNFARAAQSATPWGWPPTATGDAVPGLRESSALPAE